MTPNLNKLLQVFLDLKIDLVIVGGFAAALHGSSVVTKDLDLCLILTPDNIDKLRAALKDVHPRLRITPQKLSFLEFPKTNQGFNNLYLETDLGIVDIVSSITGVGDFARVAANAETISLFGYSCKVMSVADLMASKKALGRPKDLAVVRELEETQQRKPV